MNIDDQNEVTEQSQPVEEKTEADTKQSIFKKAVSKASAFINNAKTTIESKIEDSQKKKQLVSIFEAKACRFYCYQLDKLPLFYGIKDADKKTILFLDENKEKIFGNMELSSEGQVYIVNDFDKKNCVSFSSPSVTNTTLDCFTAFYITKQKTESPSPTINHTNNINIGGDNYGDIQAINQSKMSNIDELEKLINNYKPTLFGKGKQQKQEAQEMFVTFKSNIQNNIKPDKTFLDKFLSILGILVPAAITLVTSIVGL